MVEIIGDSLHWPEDQLFLDAREFSEQMSRCETGFSALCREMRIDADLKPFLKALYLPFAAWMAHRCQVTNPRNALVLGLCGGQGSGKSTLATLLSYVLKEAFGLVAVGFSIDDIYKTKEERETLAAKFHPLFVTRGVPMTHDIELGIETIERIRSQGENERTRIPVFDKALDTRLPESEWPIVTGKVDIIIFDGWCVGAKPQSEAALVQFINPLEEQEDQSGEWRRRVNDALAGPYQTLFSLIDVLALLKVPSMGQVFDWRRLQERKLRVARAESNAKGETLSIMSDEEIERFVMHYERLTRHILDEMPQRADIVLELDATHNAAAIMINNPLDRNHQEET